MLGNVKVQNALQEALRKRGIDENSFADEMIKIRKNWDWRAKEAYVKLGTKFLGYGGEEQQPIAQVGNIVNNWKVTK